MKLWPRRTATPMRVVFASTNLNFGRSREAHAADLLELVHAPGVYAVAVQELTQMLRRTLRIRRSWRIVQKRRRAEAGGEAVMVHRALKVRHWGVRQASLRLFGQQIGRRVFPWAVVKVPGLARPVCFISVHIPPKRMQGSPLDDVYFRRLRQLILRAERLGLHFIVMGDWNMEARAVKARLHLDAPPMIYGSRIDLAVVDPRLAELAELKWWEEQDPARDDNHPVLYLSVRPISA